MHKIVTYEVAIFKNRKVKDVYLKVKFIKHSFSLIIMISC